MNGNSFYLEPPLMCNVNGLAERPLKFDTVWCRSNLPCSDAVIRHFKRQSVKTTDIHT
jgi:hypothetical protein